MPNYNIFNNTEVNDSCITPNCATIDDGIRGNCIYCKNGYDLTESKLKCVPSIPGCFSYDENGNCLQCSNGLFPLYFTKNICNETLAFDYLNSSFYLLKRNE